MAKQALDLVKRYQQFNAHAKQPWAASPLASTFAAPRPKDLNEFYQSFTELRRQADGQQAKLLQASDIKSTPQSPLNRSRESLDAVSQAKKAASSRLTADSQEDLQVLNNSDSDSNVEREALNAFYNATEEHDDFVAYVSQFEGGGRRA